MDRKRMTFPMLAFVFIYGIYGISWAGDGAKPPDLCKDLPEAIFGPIIDAEFIVFRDGEHYHIVSVLKKGNKRHLLQYKAEATKCLCSTKKETCYSLENIYDNQNWAACREKVEEKFGLNGIPVMMKETLEINMEQDCADQQKAMISGTVKIRVVPPRSPSKTEK